MKSLTNIKEMQHSMQTRNLDELSEEKMLKEFSKANERLIFLDYDGTLTGFHSDPRDAKPDDELKDIVRKLVKEEKNKVVVISGRDKDTLGEWMGEFGVTLIAEHGVWIREKDKDWRTVVAMKGDWKKEIMPILEMYVQRTPGSFIEEKDFSLVWHYRKVETGLGELRTRELASHLKYISSNSNLQVLEGDHVVEIKDREVNKGRTALQWLEKTSHDFVMAIGDDMTDEDTFKAMPKDAYTIKVGSKTSAARFNVTSHEEVRKLLKAMIAY